MIKLDCLRPNAAKQGLALLLSASLFLTSCGSGTVVAGGGVGTGGTGVISGAVTGFGSIILNGTHISSATGQYLAESITAPSVSVSPQKVTLGQKLDIQLGSDGNPTLVQIEPDLVGQVTAVSPGASLTVNGMTVSLASSSSGATPPTFLVGYSVATAIQVGDWVQVNGSVGYDSHQIPYILATQVRLMVANPGFIRVSGPIQALTGHSLQVSGMIFGYQGTTPILSAVFPTGSAPVLAVGQWANVWSATTSSPGQAGQIQINTLQGGSGKLTLSGIVSQVNGTSFLVDGFPVQAGLSQPPVNGQYVTVQGSVEGLQGVLQATVIIAYSATPVSLTGTIAELASASNFIVRGASVNLTSTTSILSANGTPLTASAIQENSYVQVQGTISGNQVSAQQVIVYGGVPVSAVVDYLGTVTQVQSATSFTLTLMDGGQQQVTLPSNAVFTNGTTANLTVGALVSIEAVANAANRVQALGVDFWLLPGSASTINLSQSFQASGVVYNYNAGTGQFSLNGLTIQMGAGSTLPTGFGNGFSVDVLLKLAGTRLVSSMIYPDDSL